MLNGDAVPALWQQENIPSLLVLFFFFLPLDKKNLPNTIKKTRKINRDYLQNDPADSEAVVNGV